MCTRGRLVQAATVSDWFGMPMPDAPVPPANIALRPGGPSSLEISIDPAAHGEAGLGPIRRGVRLTTATGETMEFTVTATVVPGAS